MGEMIFEVKLRNCKSRYHKFVNYDDINSFTRDLLRRAKVPYKLTKLGEYSRSIVPTNWYRVATEIKKVVEKFFEENVVRPESKGSTIYLDFYEDQDFIDVNTDKPNIPEEDILAVIEWRVA